MLKQAFQPGYFPQVMMVRMMVLVITGVKTGDEAEEGEGDGG